MKRENLIFTSAFSLDTTWRGKYALRMGSLLPHNKEQIVQGLRFMSPESIRNRFLGSKRSFTEQELQFLTDLDGWNHYAIGIEERVKLKRGIAIIRMARSPEIETIAEVAITIIDEYQKKGLGSLLLQLMALAAYERGIEQLSFTFLPQNNAIVKLLSKVGQPIPGQFSQDAIQMLLPLNLQLISEIRLNLPIICPEIAPVVKGVL